MNVDYEVNAESIWIVVDGIWGAQIKMAFKSPASERVSEFDIKTVKVFPYLLPVLGITTNLKLLKK